MAEPCYPMVVVALDEADGGGFMAYAPDLYGCMGDGATAEAAIADLQSAMLEWIDEAQRQGRSVPSPGSAAHEFKQKQASLHDLVKAQDRAIKTQDGLIKEQKREIERIREELKEASAAEAVFSFFDPSARRLMTPQKVVAMSVRRRSVRAAN